MLRFSHDSKVPKYKQIVSSVIDAIERGELKRGDQLASINEISEEYYIARDTVEKAYKALKAMGIIESVRGKGYYILSEKPTQLRVLLVINKLSAYKKAIYEAFVNTLGQQATVSLFIHHGNALIFKEILKENLGNFHFYAIMPHFYEEADKSTVLQLIRQIPTSELVILDKDVPELQTKYRAVFQDFSNDIYNALVSGADLFNKYEELVLVFPQDVKYPKEIITGFRNFCIHHHKPYRIIDKGSDEPQLAHKAYVVLEDSDLAELIKKCKQQQLLLGQDVGVVAFNDTPLKEVLADGITVVSTDHPQMGRTAAELILHPTVEKRKNPFAMIRRHSL
ncbi:MAG: GntR family transcriptional regulator [Spirosomaceae bacterium]|jgi:DNA-binding transcriptional regulator YhcF (GntR family)|nr:GntR family transcriptional regulator [Spirosomataceae bacterium]